MPYQFDFYQGYDAQSLDQEMNSSIAFSTPSTSASVKVATCIQNDRALGVVFYQLHSIHEAEPIRPFSNRQFRGIHLQSVAQEVEIFLNSLPPESAYWAKTSSTVNNDNITITVFYP